MNKDYIIVFKISIILILILLFIIGTDDLIKGNNFFETIKELIEGLGRSIAEFITLIFVLSVLWLIFTIFKKNEK